MTTVNVHHAKTNFSRILAAIEDGSEKEVVIARYGKPIAVLSPVPKRQPIIIGIAKGEFTLPDNFDDDDEAIARMFNGEDD